MLPGSSMRGDSYNVRWDPREDFEENFEDPEGFIGEDKAGIWTARHPSTLLIERPELWDVLCAWEFGQHEITERDYRKLSNFELECKRTLIEASEREKIRRFRSREDDNENGGED